MSGNKIAWRGAVAALMLGLVAASLSAGIAEDTRLQRAERLYAERCADCHSHPRNNIPPRASLGFRNPEMIVHALSAGSMSTMAEGLSAQQIRDLAFLLSGREPAEQAADTSFFCSAGAVPVKLGENDWPVIGRDLHNTRFQGQPGLAAAEVSELELRWAWAYPGGASGPPVVAGGRLFLASGLGQVIALDLATGCEYWRLDTGRGVRSVSVGQAPGTDTPVVLFGNDQGTVTALDAKSGAVLWSRRVEEHVLARITAPPVLFEDTVLVPVSSIEDPLTHDPQYPCCTSRGALVALSARDGALRWKAPTLVDAASEVAPVNGVRRFSPAGGSVFTPVSVDARRRLAYVATAESYDMTDPIGAYSVIAFQLDSGERVWERAFVPDAAKRETVCDTLPETDCRNVFSLSTSPLLHTDTDGRQRLLVGQKWGYVYALDPDAAGALLWRKQFGSGGDMGGIMYGLGADGDVMLVPIAEVDAQAPQRPGGLAALDPATGALHWHLPGAERSCSWGSEGCSGANAAAVTTIPGVVFTGSWDGHVAAHATADGAPLWLFDTARHFSAVNGGEASGGQVSGYPVVVADGAVVVTSGASSMAKPGNALLVFGIPGVNGAADQ